MAKVRKSLLIVFASIMFLALGMFVLTACAGNAEYSVTFMVRENGVDGDWQQVGEVVKSKDGKVELPTAPSVDGYTFRAWYTDPEFKEGTEFDENKVESDVTVYGRYVETTVNISLNGEASTEQKLKELQALTEKYEEEAAGMGLSFDGWYTDKSYTQKYEEGMDATDLYGRYMAEVTFTNGYAQDDYKMLVQIDTTMEAPDQTEDGFVKYYMSSEDISYEDASGNKIDFDEFTVNKNTTINVIWKTPYLKYEKIEGTANYYSVTGLDYSNHSDEIARFPILSFPSQNVTIDGSTKGTVVAVKIGDYDYTVASNAKKLIYNEGIKYIKGLQYQSGCTVEEVKLPDSLVILEESFWNMGNSLKSITLPDNLEVVIDCFWSDYSPVLNINSYRNNGYKFDIKIPASVTNLALVPNNLDLSVNSKFKYDDGRLYAVKDGKKILVSEYRSNVQNGVLDLRDTELTGIQVGILSSLEYENLLLPATFAEVGYNNDRDDYKEFYDGSRLTPHTIIANPNVAPSGASSESYAVVSNLEKISYVAFDLSAMPSGVSDYAFVDSDGNPYNGNSELYEGDKVVFIGEIEKGQSVNITITKRNTKDEKDVTVVTYPVDIKSGDTLSLSELLENVDLPENVYNSVVTELGAVYEGGVVTHNLYLDIAFTKITGGFTAKVNADGKTATVTGFDAATAEDIGGVYRLNITETVEIDGKTYTVTAIADDAFKGNNQIAEIFIANTVTTIGARAFMNMQNVTLVDVTPGGLQVIGEYAFAGIGCETEGDEINTKVVATDGVTIKIPLANLTDIQPYAFKSKAIQAFTAVEGEETRGIQTTLMFSGMEGITEGMFIYALNGSGDNRAIVKYVGIDETKAMKNSKGEDINVNVQNAQLIAIAGGAEYTSYSTGLSLGFSIRAFDIAFGTNYPELVSNVFSFEIMEGSVYYGGESMYMYFGIVSKVHANAFTDMEDSEPDVHYYNLSYDEHMNIEQIKTQDKGIFEEGWWEGKANSENTFMQTVEADDAALQ